VRFQQAADLARFRVAVERLLGEQQLAIHVELKDAALAGDQLPRRDVSFKLPDAQDFVRQTDGARRVASKRAVLKRDVKLEHDRAILSPVAHLLV